MFNFGKRGRKERKKTGKEGEGDFYCHNFVQKKGRGERESRREFLVGKGRKGGAIGEELFCKEKGEGTEA